MAEAPAPAKPGAAAAEAAAPAAAPAKRPLFSPVGYVIVLVIMAVEGIVVYMLAKQVSHVQPPVAAVGHGSAPVVVDLGQMDRELSSGDAANMLTDQFMIQVSLVLNPAFENIAEIQTKVEGQKPILRDIVQSEIIDKKAEAELRRHNILELLREEILQKVNKELGAGPAGQEVIQKVIFPERKLPPRR
jgi:flagellar basal body-associated protein FliL